MFNLFKSSEEKRQEQIAAYIDQQMGTAERSRFEAELKQDAALQEMLEAQQEVKALLSQMPKLKAPRNFVLDPAVYGGKAPAPSLIERLYPKMRLATAAASFLFVIVLGAGLINGSANLNQADENVAMAPVASEPQVAADSAEEAAPVMPVGTATAAPQPTLAASVEKSVEVQSDPAAEVESADEAAVEQENYDIAADRAEVFSDDADGASLMAEEAPAGLTAGSADSEEIQSPRELEPELPEGERMAEPEVPIVPEATSDQAVARQQEKVVISGDNQESVEQLPEDLTELRSSGEAATPNGATTTLWVLGILVLILILSTLFMRSRID